MGWWEKLKTLGIITALTTAINYVVSEQPHKPIVITKPAIYQKFYPEAQTKLTIFASKHPKPNNLEEIIVQLEADQSKNITNQIYKVVQIIGFEKDKTQQQEPQVNVKQTQEFVTTNCQTEKERRLGEILQDCCEELGTWGMQDEGLTVSLIKKGLQKREADITRRLSHIKFSDKDLVTTNLDTGQVKFSNISAGYKSVRIKIPFIPTQPLGEIPFSIYFETRERGLTIPTIVSIDSLIEPRITEIPINSFCGIFTTDNGDKVVIYESSQIRICDIYTGEKITIKRPEKSSILHIDNKAFYLVLRDNKYQTKKLLKYCLETGNFQEIETPRGFEPVRGPGKFYSQDDTILFTDRNRKVAILKDGKFEIQEYPEIIKTAATHEGDVLAVTEGNIYFNQLKITESPKAIYYQVNLQEGIATIYTIGNDHDQSATYVLKGRILTQIISDEVKERASVYHNPLISGDQILVFSRRNNQPDLYLFTDSLQNITKSEEYENWHDIQNGVIVYETGGDIYVNHSNITQTPEIKETHPLLTKNANRVFFRVKRGGEYKLEYRDLPSIK